MPGPGMSGAGLSRTLAAMDDVLLDDLVVDLAGNDAWKTEPRDHEGKWTNKPDTHLVVTAEGAVPALFSDFPMPSNLQPHEKKALTFYGTAEGYKLINPFLHQHGKVFVGGAGGHYEHATPAQGSQAKQVIAALDSAFAKAKPLTHAVKVERRTGADQFGKDSLVGKDITCEAYISTATHLTTHGYGYESKPVLWEIRLPEGTKALPGNDFENEIILNRGGVFHVTADEELGDGTRRLIMTYQPHKDPSDVAAKDEVKVIPEAKPEDPLADVTVDDLLMHPTTDPPYEWEKQLMPDPAHHSIEDFGTKPLDTKYADQQGNTWTKTFFTSDGGYWTPSPLGTPASTVTMMLEHNGGVFLDSPGAAIATEHETVDKIAHPTPAPGHVVETWAELDTYPEGTHIETASGFGAPDEFVKVKNGVWGNLLPSTGKVIGVYPSSGFEQAVDHGGVKVVAGDLPGDLPKGEHYAPPEYGYAGWSEENEAIFEAKPVGTNFTPDGPGPNYVKTTSNDWAESGPASSVTVTNYGMTSKHGTFSTEGPIPLKDALAAYNPKDFMGMAVMAKDAPVGSFYKPPNEATGEARYFKIDADWWQKGDSNYKVDNAQIDGFKKYVTDNPALFPDARPSAPPPPEQDSPDVSAHVNLFKQIPGTIDDPDWPLLDFDATEHNFEGDPYNDPYTTLGNNTVSRIGDYTSDWAIQVNDDLRNSTSDVEHRDSVRQFDQAFRPILEPAMFLRKEGIEAVGLKGAQFYSAQEKYDGLKALVGKTLVDKGYMSTSYDENGSTVTGSPTFALRIHAPAGTPAAFGQPFSNFSEEHEVILKHGLPMEVTGVTWNKTSYGANMFVLDLLAHPEKMKDKPSKEPGVLPKTAKSVKTLQALPPGTTLWNKDHGEYMKSPDGHWLNTDDQPHPASTSTELAAQLPTWHVTPAEKPTEPTLLWSDLELAPVGSTFASALTGQTWTKIAPGAWKATNKTVDGLTKTVGNPTVNGNSTGVLTLPKAGHQKVAPQPGFIAKQEFIDAPVGTIWHSPKGGDIVKQPDDLWKHPDGTLVDMAHAVSGKMKGSLEKPFDPDYQPVHAAAFGILDAVDLLNGINIGGTITVDGVVWTKTAMASGEPVWLGATGSGPTKSVSTGWLTKQIVKTHKAGESFD